MRGARVFCIGWVTSALMRFAAEWLGYGPEPGLVTMAKGVMLGLTFGITAVAMFGDRRLAHPTHTNDRGES